MGITISYRLAQEAQYAQSTLDHVQKIATIIKKEQAEKLGIHFEIYRHVPLDLIINIGNCETLGFRFQTWEELEKIDGYASAVLKDFKHINDDRQGEHYEKYPGQKLLWAADFCKTQFSEKLVEHKWVADIIKEAAARCKFAVVNDEGEYYHSGNLDDAAESIQECGAMIEAIGSQLQGLGWEKADIIIKGGKTKIKPRKHGKNNT